MSTYKGCTQPSEYVEKMFYKRLDCGKKNRIEFFFVAKIWSTHIFYALYLLMHYCWLYFKTVHSLYTKVEKTSSLAFINVMDLHYYNCTAILLFKFLYFVNASPLSALLNILYKFNSCKLLL